MPGFEVNALMELLYKNLLGKRKKLIDNDVRLRVSGDIRNFPESVKKELQKTMEATKNCSTMIMNLALGYSGRGEILEAVRKLAGAIARGDIQQQDIEKMLSELDSIEEKLKQ